MLGERPGTATPQIKQAMNQQVFAHTHRVTYAECTVGNHVYYGRYLDLLEEARGEFFRSLGTTFLQWQEQGVIFPVIEVQLKYRAPARYDEVLRIEVWLGELRGVKLVFNYRMLKADGKTVVEGATTHACTSMEERPIRIPAELTEKLAKFLEKSE